jgi:uncharacterized protein YggE
MQNLFRVLAGRGILDKDMQTQQFSVSPRYRAERSTDSRELTGYRVANQLRVVVRDLSAIGSILDELVRVGANSIDSINFTVSDTQALLDSARAKAMADAQRKAHLYASSGNQKLGRILRIVEHAAVAPPPLRASLAYAPTEAAVPVATGELSFEIRVTVAFALAETH